jgi:CheY-like chemotaxis protein
MKERGTLLLVEDSPDDAYFIVRAIKKVCPEVYVAQVRDGEEARQYLAGEGEFRDRGKYPLPDLVLLDIKLPRLSGLELLEWIRSVPDHGKLPAMILSSSDEAQDVAQAKRLGVLGYHIKPVDPSGLARVATFICSSWNESLRGNS